MSTVTKRGDTYRIRVSAGYDINGKQIMKSMTWKPAPGMTKKQIEKELDRQRVLFEEKVNSGQYSDGTIKFEAFAREWFLQIEKEDNLKHGTIKRFHQLEERTYKAIGHLQIGKITTRQIQSFINNLAEDGINQQTGGGLSTKTQSLYLNFISDVFNYGIKCGIVANNPCRNVRTIKKPKKESAVYTLEEAQRFIKLLDEQAPSKYKLFFTLALYGGFRRGELLGFEWKDIDFDNGIITVNRTSLFSKDKGTYTSTPKTKTSQRSLKLPDMVIQQLKQFRAEQNIERLKLGDQWHDTDRIFTAWNGEPMGVDSARHWLTKFCKRNNIPYVNVHSFRHLNASLLINNGVDVRTVSATLGHSQTSTTLNIYAHAFQETQAKASEAVANALDFKQNKA